VITVIWIGSFAAGAAILGNWTLCLVALSLVVTVWVLETY
jgi:hypothetical protein